MEKFKSDSETEKDNQINDLIQSILSLKKIKSNETKKESPEIKLARRLSQRSYPKLSEKIAFYLITRYEIDYNKLPSREDLIQLMIDFLGNIQKNKKYYNLKNNMNEVYSKISKIIGHGSQGTIYSFNLTRFRQTKKIGKQLALKEQKYRIPYDIDIHICSSILLVLYGFQPKYYNKYFMEIGNYENKSKKRGFHSINVTDYKKSTVENNIKWFILFNFTNIRDQIYNFMEREYNKELVKIDIKHLNSETREKNAKYNLTIFDKYESIFKGNKEIIIKELDKILSIKEDFILDLIIFRTRRGCFEIENKKLLREIKCLCSSYKVIKIQGDNLSFNNILYKSRENYEKSHLSFNPALSWMLFIFFQKNIIEEKQYDNYIDKFNQIAEKYENISKSIENKIENKQKYYDIEYSENSNDCDFKENIEIIKEEQNHKSPEKINYFNTSKEFLLQKSFEKNNVKNILPDENNMSKNNDDNDNDGNNIKKINYKKVSNEKENELNRIMDKNKLQGIDDNKTNGKNNDKKYIINLNKQESRLNKHNLCYNDIKDNKINIIQVDIKNNQKNNTNTKKNIKTSDNDNDNENFNNDNIEVLEIKEENINQKIEHKKQSDKFIYRNIDNNNYIDIKMDTDENIRKNNYIKKKEKKNKGFFSLCCGEENLNVKD